MACDLYNKLKEYSRYGRYPFHMPGHKMARGIEIDNLLSMDITEIDGFDNLHNPDGIIKEAQDKYASLFGAKKTFFAVNGATGALQAVLLGLCGEDSKVIMARNCHRSVYSAMILTGAKTVYVMPEYFENSDIPAGVTAESIKKAIEENKDASVVVITSPTAEGIVSDIESISEIVHKNGMILVIDEAHGSHFKFSKEFPKTAIQMGADVVVQSAHKTLPAPTQTAVIHIGSDRVDAEKIREALSVIETSSPSYMFMALLDHCREYIEQNGEELYSEFTKWLITERKRLKNLKNLKLMDMDSIGKFGISDIDISKIVVYSDKVNCTDISDILRKKYNFEMEMGCFGHFMAITTISDDIDKITELVDAIIEIDKELKENSKTLVQPKLLNLKQEKTLRQAYYAKKEYVDFYDAQGRISAEFVIPYPPGIPVISPGEIITKQALINIENIHKCGVEITGVKYSNLEKLNVLM